MKRLMKFLPDRWQSLSPTTREKALEIAKRLLKAGNLDPAEVVQYSILEASIWATRRTSW